MAYKNFKKTEIIEEVGKELRKIRNERKLTLAQVAGALEKEGTYISPIMLGRIETGQRRINDDLFHFLCNIYHVSSDEISIKACQAHISALQEENDSDKTDSASIAEEYEKLPPDRQADIRTMIRMFSQMDKYTD